MSKPRITAAAVRAAHDALDDHGMPENYFSVSSDEQRRMREVVIRQALIAAHVADQQEAAA